MCNGNLQNSNGNSSAKAPINTAKSLNATTVTDTDALRQRRRRGKREKASEIPVGVAPTAATPLPKQKKKTKKSKALKRHGQDAPSGGFESLAPSLIGVGILVFGVMARQGFRGRASVAGIDLGTTNSVICVQAQSKGVGTIDCIPDPQTGSPIIPSVVSFLEPRERKVGPSSKIPSLLVPHPSHVVVGHTAKQRIDSHPHHTLYHAKRVLGRPSTDRAVLELQNEVEFSIVQNNHDAGKEAGNESVTIDDVAFQVDQLHIRPQQVGAYVVNHLIQITKAFLGHDNVKSAVLAVPAKFDTLQRQRTMEAFQAAGVKIARILEEPSAAALAYGLHKKDGVEKILVYDFGGGTLDISILHVAEGYCEVIGSDGDDRLGGADFDAAVASILTQDHSKVLEILDSYKVDAEDLAAACHSQVTEAMPLCSVSSFHTLGEQLKIALSQTSDSSPVHATCLRLPELPSEDGTNSRWNLLQQAQANPSTLCHLMKEENLTLTLENYNHAVAPLLDRAVLPISRLLQDLTLNESEIDEIVMVGGTTRMPQVRELVRKAFSTAQMNTHIDPDLTVAYGAASVID